MTERRIFVSCPPEPAPPPARPPSSPEALSLTVFLAVWFAGATIGMAIGDPFVGVVVGAGVAMLVTTLFAIVMWAITPKPVPVPRSAQDRTNDLLTVLVLQHFLHRD